MGRRITIVIHSLDGGGAERMAAVMANRWAEHGDQVCLLTLDDASNDMYSLATSVRRVGLDLMGESPDLLRALRSNARRIARLRAAIRSSDPETIVSLVDKTNILTLLASIGLGPGVIVCEHTDPRRHDIGPLWSALRRLVYRRCRALVVLTPSIAQYAKRFVGKRNVYVAPTPVPPIPPEHPALRPEQDPGRRFAVSMGRLEPNKGFDRLIEAFSSLAPAHPDWNLRILGDGPQRVALERQVQQLQLEGRVLLPGWISQPYDLLRRSHLYVLSSHFEGFPVSLLEAMACGLPVVSFDCQSGPAEIVRPEIDGLLTPPDDTPALARAMDRLMSDDSLRRRLAERAGDVVERFSPESYFSLWQRILAGDPDAAFRPAPLSRPARAE